MDSFSMHLHEKKNAEFSIFLSNSSSSRTFIFTHVLNGRTTIWRNKFHAAIITLPVVKLGMVHTTFVNVPGNVSSHRNFLFLLELSCEALIVSSKYL